MKAILEQLDDSAHAHVLSELGSTNLLGRLVASYISLENGSLFSVVPEQRSANLYDFSRPIFPTSNNDGEAISGGFVREVPSTEQSVSKLVFDYLHSQANCVFICESFLLRAGDLGGPTSLPTRTLRCNDFVYHVALSGDSEAQVADVVRTSYVVPGGFAVLSSLLPTGASELRAELLSSEALDSIAQHAEGVVLGAYDGESVLVWMRRGSTLAMMQPSVL